jgi:EAL domain-containing protein (putative c-di-GMP-specific phosphodiesterase class I)
VVRATLRGTVSCPIFALHHTTRSNRLSDAPTAQSPLAEREATFFTGHSRLNNLSTVFQPIVWLEDAMLFGYEALVRSKAPNFSPSGLFSQAAAVRSAGRLGRMIREIAVSLSAGMPLFVNLHPSEIEEGWILRPDDPIFLHDDDIYLEISESVPLTHADLCEAVQSLVKARTGVYLVVDDFGAGHSNLELIIDLSPKLVKLDRRLVENLDRNARKQKLVSMMVRLCKELGAEVVAEGIETRDELSALRDAGARYGQGYLFGRPGFPRPSVSWPPPSLDSAQLPPTVPPPAPSSRPRSAS